MVFVIARNACSSLTKKRLYSVFSFQFCLFFNLDSARCITPLLLNISFETNIFCAHTLCFGNMSVNEDNLRVVMDY